MVVKCLLKQFVVMSIYNLLRCEKTFKGVIIMTQLKGYKIGILIFICLIFLFTLILGCNNQKQSQKKNQPGFIDKNNIVSFKVHNIITEEKEIKNQSDRDKIIDLINSVKITSSGVEQRDGVGFGVIITYSNGDKFSASYLATTMVYSTNENKAIWCDIDKNIVDDLRNYYDRN